MQDMVSQIDTSPSFATIQQARDWLEREGWRYRPPGGYEKNTGFATMHYADGTAVINIHKRPS